MLNVDRKFCIFLSQNGFVYKLPGKFLTKIDQSRDCLVVASDRFRDKDKISDGFLLDGLAFFCPCPVDDRDCIFETVISSSSA